VVFTNAKTKESLKEPMPFERLYNDCFGTNTFKKFINWISEEFTLYLQDDSNGLTVFFPNGWFSLKILEFNNNDVEFIIVVKSKSTINGNQINKKIEVVLNHIKKLKEDGGK
tara:strand:+ start:900 stop:1235 length:336 start_codon:yes stop_codon:yes gene_type:complete